MLRTGHLRVALVLAGALIPALADDRRFDTYRDNRDSYRYGNSVAPGYRYGGDPVTSALRDLDNIFRRARVDRHEADHFRDALRDLDAFRARAARGHFDRHALDHAIDEMRDLARAHQLHPRDREIIARHIGELRYLRDRGLNPGYSQGFRRW